MLLGSSAYYVIPSYCGDGDNKGAGEQCDASVGASNPAMIGGYAVAQIATGAPLEVEKDVSKVTYGYAISNITASLAGLSTKPGTAEVKLQCSCTEDAACGSSSTTGCGIAKCCFNRPTISNMIPPDDQAKANKVCRNTAISIEFSEQMDLGSFGSTDTVKVGLNETVGKKDGIITEDEYLPNVQLELQKIDNVVVTPRVSGAAPPVLSSCPSDYIEWPLNPNAKSTSTNALVRAWDWVKSIISSLFGHAVIAGDTYKCLVPVIYEQIGNKVNVIYKTALVSKGEYTLTVKTDSNGSDANKEGVLSKNNVSICLDGACSATKKSKTHVFVTGEKICKLDIVKAEDLGRIGKKEYEASSSGFYSKTDEKHDFVMTAQTVNENTKAIEDIIPLPNIYAWEWKWDSSNEPNDIISSEGTTSTASAIFKAVGGKNGTENVMASAKITADIFVPSTKDQLKTAAISETAFLCSNPWPTGELTVPFIESDSKTNFSFFYCMDAGNSTTTVDDLPALAAPVTSLSTDATLIKELVFKVGDTKDAIGMRVYKNDKYLTPLAWFKQAK
ncbi:MAG: hypothetical protein AAB664_02670, partial [Patescibacteria group bacterium]